MKYLLPLILSMVISLNLLGQSPGDTIVVETFNYNQTYGVNQWSGGIRDTVIEFPDLSNVSYEKILMLYNMRCKDGNVSPPISGQTDIGCGEWDISCNTYIHDSTSIDSVSASTSSHSISNFSGTTYNYSTQPTYNYYRTLQPNANVVNIISETQSTIGTGATTINHPISTSVYNGKSQYIFTSAELIAAGVVAGDMDGLMLNITSGSEDAGFLRVRIKTTTKTTLNASNPDLNGFTEVFFHNTNLTTGNNRLQFSTPFNWDGTSNVIVEFSFNNPTGGNTINFAGDNTGNDYGIYTIDDKTHYFNGSNFIQADNYQGIGGNGDRTMETWINSSVHSKEIIGWGVNAATEKWTFRINGNSTIRAEVNGGFIYGTTNIADGQWHHVACVLSGSSIANAKLYVDGVLETVGSSQAQTVNTNATTNLTIGRGPNNTYFDGLIDDVRIWNTILSAATIQDWMHKTVDASHPNYSNLALYYPLNEGTNTTITDASPNGNHGTIQNGEVWKSVRGVDMFKGFQNTQERPSLGFLQGNYTLNTTIDTLYEAIQNIPNIVNQYQIFPNYGTIKSDSIGIIASNTYWDASGFENYYDENGVLINSLAVTVDGSITPTTLTYQTRSPMKFEIMSFVTPYGINLDLGQNGKTWTFDVTDFAPILKGNRRMTIERGGQWMEDMDIRFVYIVGTPPRDVLDIQQIWKVNSRNYTSIQNDESFAPKNLLMNPNGSYFKVRSSITGHGQEGEFIPQAHYINVNGGADEFIWQVWKECSENPVFPQGGTWIYDRAGWCPGMATDLEESDLTPYVTAGQTATIDYGVNGGSGDTRYIPSHQLVTYGAANFTLDAAIVDIATPSDKVEYSKSSTLCGMPVVIIQNTGTSALTSLTIEYWVNNATSKQTYTWNGNLDFLEKEEVTLPVSADLWSNISGTTNTFSTSISSPNGGTDEYSFNNTTQSTFDIPDVIQADFAIRFRTNSQGFESRYYLYDDAGNQLFVKQGMSSNTEYRDTFNLAAGCYSLVVQDSDDDGIDFWANSDGAGYCRIYRTDVPVPIKILEPDFGGSITYNFTVEFPLPTNIIENAIDIKVFPNPASDYFVLKSDALKDAQIQIFNAVGQLITLPNFPSGDEILFKTKDLPKGLYFVNVTIEGELITRKVIVE